MSRKSRKNKESEEEFIDTLVVPESEDTDRVVEEQIPETRATRNAPQNEEDIEVSVQELLSLENSREIFGVGRPVLVGALSHAGIDIKGVASKSAIRRAVEAYKTAEAF